MSVKDGFIIACAWPETLCKQAGSWYDTLMNDLGFSRNGYYKVGHAALILINNESGSCEYFDFGRYHAPNGFGRVRNAQHDHELRMHTVAQIENGDITNVPEILSELFQNESGHGTGELYGSHTAIHYQKAKNKLNEMIAEEFISDGPFIQSGTNCSRFVNKVLRAGRPKLDEHVLLKFPFTVSPTPMWNLRALQNEIVCVGNPELVQETNSVYVTEYATRSSSSSR